MKIYMHHWRHPTHLTSACLRMNTCDIVNQGTECPSCTPGSAHARVKKQEPVYGQGGSGHAATACAAKPFHATGMQQPRESEESK